MAWGCYRKVTSNSLMNRYEAVKLATNKPIARAVMLLNGVHTPEPIGEHSMPPYVARPAHTSRGRHFMYIERNEDLWKVPCGWHVMDYYPKVKEYRVHVASGKILYISDKMYEEGNLQANHAVTQNSWRVLKWDEYDPEMCSMSVKAVKALGLDFGAVDMMVGEISPKYCVCEINTAPTLTTSELGRAKYVRHFKAFFDGTLKPFDKEFKKGRSWAWKEKDYA